MYGLLPGLLYRAPELLRGALAAMWAPPGSPTSQKMGLLSATPVSKAACKDAQGRWFDVGVGAGPRVGAGCGARADSDPRGSQKGDVYAFGIVLYEIQGRRGPYGDCALAVDEVLRRVLHPEPGQPPFR